MSEEWFESSDTIRHALPLRHLQTVQCAAPLALERGGMLPDVTVAYETYGRLNETRNNAILICHAISGDSHVARHDEADDPGWWDIVVGPGKSIDTDRYFVVCSNLLGGCRGTTGPGSLNPATGRPYGRGFPTVTLADMVEAQRRLADSLGIQQWRAVVGGSLGGHQSLTWAIRYPERVRGAILLASSARLTAQALAFDVVGRNAIRRDPHYHGGQYYGKDRGPEVGLALARMIGHITYLSREAMTRKFDTDRLRPREMASEFEKIFSVGSYLGHQGSKFVERFDANSYVALSLAMDLFDLGSTPQELAAALRPARCRWLIESFSSDWLFPPEQSRDMVDALIANRARVSYCQVPSTCGHDAFLLADDLAIYGELMRAFLEDLGDTASAASSLEVQATSEAHGPKSIFQQRRLDYDRITELIPPGASVLDLGCGSGLLLAWLQQRGPGRLLGVELDEHQLLAAVRRGVDVVHADLDQGLKAFGDAEFDWVVLSRTLQAVHNVEGVIAEILRVGRRGLVSVPNLAYHKLRRMLAEQGRAPKSAGVLHYEWYNTPNIRFFSLADFEDFCHQKHIRVEQRIALDSEAGFEVQDDPNLNADLAIYVLRRETAAHAQPPPNQLA
jgi:homoserine O-acetyltransferase